jgi:lipid II isoglutaminyl synthase (glutamine-hydrolysing)
MKRYLIFLLLIVESLQLYAQHIELDIFDNLQYESKERGYNAYLKKDIFDNLIFSDSNNNELTFKKKYLDLMCHDVLSNQEAKRNFFWKLIDEYSLEKKYQATYAVDIFDKVIFEDNKNSKIEIGKDIFGNQTYEEKRNDVTISIKRDLSGNLECASGKENASLKKDIFNKWSYDDSSGNKFEFSNETWNMLKNKYGKEEDVFLFLIDQFLYF